MPDQSPRQEPARDVRPDRTVVSGPAAVSRRRKVAIIVVLMGCGYFVIDERKPPAASPAYSDSVSDPAIEELMQDEFAIPEMSAAVADHSNVNSRQPLQLPEDGFAVREVIHVDQQPAAAPMFPEPQIVSTAQAVPQPELPRRRRPAPRPKLRFTGEIEPLY